MTIYEVLISVVIILVPVNIYLLLNISSNNKKIIFDICLVFVLCLLYLINKSNLYIYLLIYKIPYIISRIYKKKTTSFILSILTTYFYVKTFSINYLIILLEYIIYILSPKNKLKYLTIIGVLLNYSILYKISISEILILISLYILILKILKLYQTKTKELTNYNEILNLLTKEQNKNISISKLTHEIKNPLAVCNGYLQMINIKDKQKTEKYLQIVKDELSRTLTIINDFTTYGKLQKLDIEEIDLSYLFEDIKSVLNPLFINNDGQIIINDSSEIYLSADYNRLKQVFINLLKNTIEAKKEQENLLVKIKVKDQDDNIKIIIEDNGVGMSKESLKHLFETFYTTKQTGTGLGVVYSKEVIELHGGSIKYTSKLNKGTKVFINIPKIQPT